jgi:hypothetical protein
MRINILEVEKECEMSELIFIRVGQEYVRSLRPSRRLDQPESLNPGRR